jgi:predicted ArsR family transcriptional regulator
VLHLAARLTTQQIADRLSISAKTADHHIQHIYTKIGVSTRAAAAALGDAARGRVLRAPLDVGESCPVVARGDAYRS